MSNHHKLRRKSKFEFHRQTKPGASPGTVVVDPNAPPLKIRVVSFGPEDCQTQDTADPASALAAVGKQPVTWIDVQGLGNAEPILELGKRFGLHPLALEDVVNTHQRPKVEDYGEYLFIVAKMLHSEETLEMEQVSVFLGKNFVITFQEAGGNGLEHVRKRLLAGKCRLRQSGADYLAYAMLDAIVDGYFPVLEQYGEKLDDLDDAIADHPTRDMMVRLHDMRSHLLILRRAVWPLREALGALAREPNRLVSDDTRVFLRDCYDHTVQIIDLIETSREMCSDLRDFYLSAVNNQMNEIMKVLTIIATIFIPLSFIAGVYGMNFNPEVSPWNMPELRWAFGYPFALGLMALVAGGLLWFFRRRRWIGP
jgi:magnesium transporter